MITILGGGVAGASLAWSLCRRGRRDVVVFDLLPVGSGSTTRAMGGFRTQHGSPLNIRLSLAARPWFEERAERVHFEPNGYLYIAESEAAWRELQRRAEIQKQSGLPITHPDPRSLVPFLEDGDLLGTNYCALDGLYWPGEILRSFIEEAEAMGAQFRYGAEAGPKDLEAEAVCVCAGIWSRRVGEELGVVLGVDPLERGVFVAGPFDWLPERMPFTLEAGSGYHFREREGRLLMTGPGDQSDWTHFRTWLQRRAPRAATEKPERHWLGYYEMTFDQHPLVGQTSREEVWASCGFSGHGVMHSPAVAESLAAMILGETPPVDVSALSPLRTEPLYDMTQL